jgi:hypothetical protein
VFSVLHYFEILQSCLRLVRGFKHGSGTGSGISEILIIVNKKNVSQ